MDRFEAIYSNTPPAPPPKPGSHDVSRMSTPINTQSPGPSPLPDQQQHSDLPEPAGVPVSQQAQVTRPQAIQDPGDQWLPQFLEDKSCVAPTLFSVEAKNGGVLTTFYVPRKQDLAEILSTPALLSGLTHGPSTAHPSLTASTEALSSSLSANIDLANHLLELESRLAHARGSAQALLLSTHASERAWRAKQSEMDHALSPFAPASLYQRLGAGVAEQGQVCAALEESFLEGEGFDGAATTERETLDWVRRYREAKKLYYLRQERKERWDEGRVGGWR